MNDVPESAVSADPGLESAYCQSDTYRSTLLIAIAAGVTAGTAAGSAMTSVAVSGTNVSGKVSVTCTAPGADAAHGSAAPAAAMIGCGVPRTLP